MRRDYGKEIDEIRGQLSEIKNLLSGLGKGPQKGDFANPAKMNPDSFAGHIPAMAAKLCDMNAINPDSRISELVAELLGKVLGRSSAGYVTYFGSYVSGERQSVWARSNVDAGKLLQLMENGIATKVLACIGSSDRLNMLLALLHAPRTAAQLVEQCGYNTTGQVYHHLKPLLAADLVTEDSQTRGTYVIQPHRVQGIIMLLAGISDMLDPKYTQGNWE